MTKKKETLEAGLPQHSIELKKHVAVIHSSSKITLLQRKIANALLYNAYDYLQVRDEHEINISWLCKLIGYDSHDHRKIKDSLINLLSTVVEWNLVDGEKIDSDGVWNASSFIADASLDGSVCTYSYSNKMRKLLFRPNVYGRLNMQVQARFQSSYGLALYENCNRYQDIGQTPWIEIIKFRKLMGIDEGKYKIFRDFKHRVLDKAIEEVNKYSPIRINPQIKKLDRKVVAIQFLIQPAAGFSSAMPGASSHQNVADVLKIKFGLSKKQLEATLSNYEIKYIKDKIHLVETSSSFRAGKISNLAKYLLSALQEDYQVAKTTLKSPSESQEKENDKQRVNEYEYKEKYRLYCYKQILDNFEKYQTSKKSQVLKDFEKFLGNSMYASIYSKEGLKNILVRDQLAKYLSQIDIATKNIITYEQWLSGRQMILA